MGSLDNSYFPSPATRNASFCRQASESGPQHPGSTQETLQDTITSAISATCFPCKTTHCFFSIHHDVTALEQVAAVRRTLCAPTGAADRSLSAREHVLREDDSVVRLLHMLIAAGRVGCSCTGKHAGRRACRKRKAGQLGSAAQVDSRVAPCTAAHSVERESGRGAAATDQHLTLQLSAG